MPAAGLGVIDQEGKFLIHLFGDAGVEDANLECERTWLSVRGGLPPFDNLDQITQRLDHSAKGANGAFARVDVVRGTNGCSFGGLRPGAVPAVHRKGPGEVGQDGQRAQVWIPQQAQRDGHPLNLR